MSTLTYSDLVIGLGEVGKPVFEILKENYGDKQVYGRDIDGPTYDDRRYKHLHICYPEVEGFPDTIIQYARQYKPDNIIIHSTVSPSILDELERKLYQTALVCALWYSPVRGNIKDGMINGLRSYTKYIGLVSDLSRFKTDSTTKLLDHMRNGGFKIETANPVSLAYAKLFDLAWYGLNIAFYQEVERTCENLGIELDPILDFIKSTEVESGGKVRRQVYYGGFIGGHCVIPAIEKLISYHDIPMLEDVITSNIKRKQELAFSTPEHHPKEKLDRPKNP